MYLCNQSIKYHSPQNILNSQLQNSVVFYFGIHNMNFELSETNNI